MGVCEHHQWTRSLGAAPWAVPAAPWAGPQRHGRHRMAGAALLRSRWWYTTRFAPGHVSRLHFKEQDISHGTALDSAQQEASVLLRASERGQKRGPKNGPVSRYKVAFPLAASKRLLLVRVDVKCSQSGQGELSWSKNWGRRS